MIILPGTLSVLVVGLANGPTVPLSQLDFREIEMRRGLEPTDAFLGNNCDGSASLVPTQSI